MKKIALLTVSLILLVMLSGCLASRSEIAPKTSQQTLDTVTIGMSKDEVKATVGFAGTENKAGNQWFYPTLGGDFIVLRFDGAPLTVTEKLRVFLSDSPTADSADPHYTNLSLDDAMVTLTDAALFDDIQKGMNIWEAANRLNSFGYYLSGTFAPTYYGTDGSVLKLSPMSNGQLIGLAEHRKADKAIAPSLVKQLACGMPWEDAVAILGGEGIDVIDGQDRVYLRLFPLRDGGILTLHAISVDSGNTADGEASFYLVRALIDNVPLETEADNSFVLPDNDGAPPLTIPEASAVRTDIPGLAYGMKPEEVNTILGVADQPPMNSPLIRADVTYRLADGSLLTVTFTSILPSSSASSVVLLGRSVDRITLDGVALQTDEAGHFLLPHA